MSKSIRLTDMGFSEDWKDWYYCDGRIHDTAGNRYNPQMILASFFGKQVYDDLVGSREQIYALKRHLQKRNKPRTISIQLELDMFGSLSLKESVINQ